MSLGREVHPANQDVCVGVRMYYAPVIIVGTPVECRYLLPLAPGATELKQALFLLFLASFIINPYQEALPVASGALN